MVLIEWLLRHDPWLQAAALSISTLGIAVSLKLTIDVCREYRAASFNGPLTYLIARTHRRSQLVILTLQIIFAMISALVFFLPPVPTNMGHPYHYVLTTITLRKLLRLGMIVVLTVASIRQAADRQLMYQVLKEERG